MRVLVTGGFGYLGGRVCLALAEAGEDVIVGARRPSADRLHDGDALSIFDVTSVTETELALEAARPDAIVHLAAVNEIESLRDPRLAYKVNCEGTYNLLTAAVRAKVDRLLYVSTFHVYGKAEGDISEATPTSPSHPYATTHRAAEDIARYFARYHGIATASLRLSNAYGAPVHPRIDRWTLVFNDLCRQAVVSGEIVLATAGGQHRDFISLHDVGRAIVHALRSDAVMHDGEVFNLGGRTSLSIREVAAIVARVAENELGAPIPVRGPEGRVTGARVNYDIAKFEATGFRLSGSMEEEIVATLALCRRAVEEGSWMPAARE